jgi:hypothetical protein
MLTSCDVARSAAFSMAAAHPEMSRRALSLVRVQVVINQPETPSTQTVKCQIRK